MKASIIVGLGFGDEGKGITTDWLCRQVSQPLVVRYSGGQQCGHTVVIDGKTHIHSNFGAGTLRGVPSYFTEHCSFYMNTLVEEYKVLISKAVTPELYMHPLAIMTTPYDVAYGRIRERVNFHGSCGLGIGSTQMRHNSTAHKVYAVDLLHLGILNQKLIRIARLYWDKLMENYPTYRDEYETILEQELTRWSEALLNYDRYIYAIGGYGMLEDLGNHLIFEGSQGILLDKDHGIFPHVTYANTTSRNAVEVCNKLGLKYPSIYYISRCYQTRHGEGPMTNDNPITLINNEAETCTTNQWQGHFRTGELDYDLLNYALEVDMAYHDIKDINMVVTCLDQRPEFVFDEKKIDHHLRYFGSYSPESKDIK